MFWAANFTAPFEDARVLSQANVLLGKIYADTTGLGDEWKALVSVRQLIHEGEYAAAKIRATPLLFSRETYVRIMAGYYIGWSGWSMGEHLASSTQELSVDESTPFGRAMALQMLAWHRQRSFDFCGHLRALREATLAFLECDPIPSYWLAQTLVPLLHTGFEMADQESVALGRRAFHALDWNESLEHQRFDCFRALSRYAFACGEIEDALQYIANAKSCKIPRSCKSHAMLHAASYALDTGQILWAKEQLCTAETMINSEEINFNCPEFRNVILSLALQYAEVNAGKAKRYLAEYHRLQANPNLSVSYDRRLDAVANISIGKIGLTLSPGDSYSIEMLKRAYETVDEYGFRYRAATAAAEIAGAQSRRKGREEWMGKALEQICRYGENSPLKELLSRKMELAHLTQSEKRIHDMVLAGKNNGEIADAMCLTEGRVANILSGVCRKYGVRGRSGLLVSTKNREKFT